MTERPDGAQNGSRRFFTLFVSLSMKWVMIVFPAALIVTFLMPLFVPNALSVLPEWLGPVIVAVVPFALGLISAWRLWRRGGAVSAVTGSRADGPTWLSSAVVNRWFYLIVLPVVILAMVILGKFGVVVQSRLVFVIALGAVLLLLGLRLADGVRRLRQP